LGGAGEPDHDAGKLVLLVGYFRLFAAHAHFGAAFAAGGLFTLKTKHY
jgi:hypothetical protein